MGMIGSFLLVALDIYFWIIVISVVMSWLIAFEVINVRNEKSRNIVEFFNKLTEPVFRPIRKFVPSIGGIDITPIIVIFGIFLLQNIIVRLTYAGPY